MKHSIKHDLTPEQLRSAVRRFAEVYVQRFQQYNATTHWLNDDQIEVRFNVKGIKLAGRLDLLPNALDLDMNVPFALQLFKSRAMKTIEDEVRPWLEKAKRGELD